MQRSRKYERYLTLLDHHRGPGKSLLEIGCGAGIFLEVALKHGWEIHGLDISSRAVELARQYCPHARLVCAPLEKSASEPNRFDLIALWDVIEHVNDPDSLLREAWSLLRVGGLLIIETPDEGCLPRRTVRFVHRVTRGRINFLNLLYYPAHRWYFSRPAMALALRRAGFGRIRFYPEITVKKFAELKGMGYGMRWTLFSRIMSAVAGVGKVVPVLRNKMVVIAAKSQ